MATAFHSYAIKYADLSKTYNRERIYVYTKGMSSQSYTNNIHSITRNSALKTWNLGNQLNERNCANMSFVEILCKHHCQ